MDQDGCTRSQERAPPHVVREGPHVVLPNPGTGGRCPPPSRRAPDRETPSTGRTAAATPARSRLVRNLSRVGKPPKSRPSTNGSMATTSPPDARATLPSRTVERPWWLPISSSRAPEPAAVASSNNRRPWSRVSQPGTGSARAQATSKSEESPEEALSCWHRRPAGHRRGLPPWLHSRAAEYRVEGVSHRHHRGERDPSVSTRPRTEAVAGIGAEVVAEVVAGPVRRPLGGAGDARLAGGHGIPAAARRDDVRHEVRPDRGRRSLPGPEPVLVETGLQLR